MPSLLASGPGSMSVAKSKGRGFLGGPMVKDLLQVPRGHGSIPGLGEISTSVEQRGSATATEHTGPGAQAHD